MTEGIKMDEVTTAPTAPETVTIDGATYYSALRIAEQYKSGLDQGKILGKGFARTAIIDVLRDTVTMGEMDIESAQSLLDDILRAAEMESAKILTKWDVYATLNGSDFFHFEDVEAQTDEEAIDKVKDSLRIEDVTLTVSFSWENGYSEEAEVRGFDYDIEDELDWSAEEA
jgi:polyhydroxyalkanoate synthesis regulator phasin